MAKPTSSARLCPASIAPAPRPNMLPITPPATSQATERQAAQPSLDGNTVELHREQAAFADAALRYRASLQFAQGRLSTLITAFKGQ